MLTRIIETACGPVEYTTVGTGEPLLYFHGTGITGEVMAPIERPLSDDGFQLIFLNRPGYGQTPLASNRSAVDCARVATALLDALGLARVSVMGSSGGAAFAATFALRHPLRTKALVLLCPQLHRWDETRWLPMTSRWTLPLLKRNWLRRILLALYRLQLPRLSASQFLKHESGARYADVASDALAQELCAQTLAAMVNGTKHPGFENDFLIFTNEDIVRAEDSLNVPTLIIHDEADPLASIDHVRWFADRFPQCETVAVRAAGHLIWVGPEAGMMHKSRVRFLRENQKSG